MVSGKGGLEERPAWEEGKLPLDEQLEVMTAAGSVDSIDPFGIVKILNQVLQFGRGVRWEAGKGSGFPE